MLKTREEKFEERMKAYALCGYTCVEENTLFKSSNPSSDYATHFSSTVLPVGVASDGTYILNKRNLRDV